jgi:hypothetical protein
LQRVSRQLSLAQRHRIRTVMPSESCPGDAAFAVSLSVRRETPMRIVRARVGRARSTGCGDYRTGAAGEYRPRWCVGEVPSSWCGEHRTGCSGEHRTGWRGEHGTWCSGVHETGNLGVRHVRAGTPSTADSSGNAVNSCGPSSRGLVDEYRRCRPRVPAVRFASYSRRQPGSRQETRARSGR